MKRFKFIFLTLIFIFITTVAMGATVTLRWDRNNEPDLAKYTAYWRAPGGEYVRNVEEPFYHQDVIVNVVNSTVMAEHPNEVTVSPPGTEWEFVLTASDSDASGNESGYSNQVDIIKPQPPGNLTIFQVIWAFIKSIFSWFA